MMDAQTAQYILNARGLFGDQAADRLHFLAQSPEGWDGRDAKPLDTALLGIFLSLGLEDKISKQAELGIFLDHLGSLVLSCCISGQALDICISRSQIEICSDSFELSLNVDQARHALQAM